MAKKLDLTEEERKARDKKINAERFQKAQLKKKLEKENLLDSNINIEVKETVNDEDFFESNNKIDYTDNSKQIVEEAKLIIDISNIKKEDLNIINQSDIINESNGIKQDKKLSYQAKKMKDYLAYQKVDINDFAKRYPKHKFREFIDELLEWENSNKSLESIKND